MIAFVLSQHKERTLISMYKIEFFENEKGISEIWNFFEKLRIKSKTNKDARIQFKQLALYIELLEKNGTNLPENITKHISEDIWELRPGNNRVLYFFFQDDTYVLLHHFKKKTQKTPTKELKKSDKQQEQISS